MGGKKGKHALQFQPPSATPPPFTSPRRSTTHTPFHASTRVRFPGTGRNAKGGAGDGGQISGRVHSDPCATHHGRSPSYRALHQGCVRSCVHTLSCLHQPAIVTQVKRSRCHFAAASNFPLQLFPRTVQPAARRKYEQQPKTGNDSRTPASAAVECGRVRARRFVVCANHQQVFLYSSLLPLPTFVRAARACSRPPCPEPLAAARETAPRHVLRSSWLL